MTIQAAGQQILNNNPGKFYIFGGIEYGVKDKYLDALKTHYDGHYIETQDFQSVFDLMKTRHLIPLIPQLYIVRYDDVFLNLIKETTSIDIKSTNIIGTIVIIYQDSKAFAKCDKFLSDYTISFDTVAPTFVQRYLVNDYPELDRRFIEFSMKSRDDYKGAQILCGLLSKVDSHLLTRYDDRDLELMFYGSTESADEHIRLGFASKDFNYMIKVIEMYPGDLDSILYTMLNTLIELDKLKVRQYTESPLKQYLNFWTKQDIYNMYMHVFDAIDQLRTISSDVYSHIVYLISILQYQRIPHISYMNWEV